MKCTLVKTQKHLLFLLFLKQSLENMLKLTVQRVKELLGLTAGKKIAVIGDVMLDRYFWGSVTRVSPEAPVPVIDYENETYHLGGAANVANNLLSLGISPILCGVLGADKYAVRFRDIAEENGISTIGLKEDVSRPTTVKTRIMGNNQHIARLDRESRQKISSTIMKSIVESLENTDKLDGIIFEDYNKGTITEVLIKKVITFASNNKIPVFVDPKVDYFFDYRNVTVIKPNLKETSIALKKELSSREDIVEAGKKILKELHVENVLLTMSSEGMMLFESNGDVSSVPTRARMVADVSGAGDTAIATLATFYVAGATMKEAATIANLAAGVICEHPGIISIKPMDLFDSVVRNSFG